MKWLIPILDCWMRVEYLPEPSRARARCSEKNYSLHRITPTENDLLVEVYRERVQHSPPSPLVRVGNHIKD